MEPAPLPPRIAPLRTTPSRLPTLFTMPRLLSPAEKLPPDVLRPLLSYLLDFRHKTTFSGICRTWRHVALGLHSYSKAQLGARVAILSEVGKPENAGLSSADQMLLEKAREYLNTKDADFEKVVLPPPQPKAFHNTVDKIEKTFASTLYHFNPNVPQIYYPVLLQQSIERAINSWMEGHSWKLEQLSQLKIYPDGATPYEIEAVKNCVKPTLLPHISKWIVDRESRWDHEKGICEIPTTCWSYTPEFTHSMFTTVLEVITRSKHLKHLVLNHAVTGISHTALMELLNKELSHCRHMTTLTFSNGENNADRLVTDWLGHDGLTNLRDTLVELPHLKKLVFDDLKTRMDVQNAQTLSEIIITRSHDDECSNIEDLVINHGCITLDAAIALLVALKDYKEPLNITFGAFLIGNQGSFPDWALILPYYDNNLNLHIRFNGNSRSTCIIYDKKSTFQGLGILGIGLIQVSHDHAKKFFKERKPE